MEAEILKRSLEEFENKLNEAYRLILNKRGRIDIGGKYYRALLWRKGNKKCLDVGCSYGIFSYILSFFYEQVDMVDLIMRKNISRIDKKNINFKILDLSKDKLPKENYETVFLLDVLEHLDNQEFGIKEIHKTLIESGRLIVSYPNDKSVNSIIDRIIPSSIADFGNHNYPLMSLNMIKNFLLKHNFKILKIENLPCLSEAIGWSPIYNKTFLDIDNKLGKFYPKGWMLICEKSKEKR
jgi:2-polyprenyl-3-methyl-5-hydroxy-6-metoxy-1,4-benzoquinol methylase